MRFPAVGDKVRGVHVLGAPYTGVIASRRLHAINPDILKISIDFTEPVQVSREMRTGIMVGIQVSLFDGRTWWAANGGHFEIIEEAAE